MSIQDMSAPFMPRASAVDTNVLCCLQSWMGAVTLRRKRDVVIPAGGLPFRSKERLLPDFAVGSGSIFDQHSRKGELAQRM